MVYYSQTAINDLDHILWGLATWKKHPLGYEHAAAYVDDITDQADSICTKLLHRPCFYKLHQKHGQMVHLYKRNKKTQWYIIYDWDADNRIAYVQKILNNYILS